MIVETPGICISVYKDVFDASLFIRELENTISESFGEELEWQTSRLGAAGSIGSHRTSLSCPVTTLLPPYQSTPLSEIFRTDVYSPIMRVVVDYGEEFDITGAAHELMSVLKYSGKAEYHAHHDHSPDTRRVYSMVAILGEPESGGHLEFPYFDAKIEPKAGSVIMFPSNFPYIHIAHPVDSGTKYSLVTWFQ